MTVTASATAPTPLLTVEEALEHLLARARPVGETETVDLAGARGRVLAREVRAGVDVPAFDNSAMDGYALRVADLDAAPGRTLRVAQRIPAGGRPRPLGRGEAARIFTGAPLPPGADAVVMQEECERLGDRVRVAGPVAPGQHVRPRGNDIRAGATVLRAGTRLRPQEMGLAASVGRGEVEVAREVRVAVFSTGDELLAPGEPPRPGAVYNSNRFILLGALAGLPVRAVDLGAVPDTGAATRAALERAAAAADVVVTTGGMSVGEEDHVRAALERTGTLEMWRVAVKPGKPVAHGRLPAPGGGEADFLGLPGNPVSTLVTFCLFVRPFVLRRAGARSVAPARYPVRAGFEWPRPGTRREYARARLEPAGDLRPPVAVPFPRQGSDVLTSAAWADGLVEIREGTTVRRGDPLPFIPFSELL